MASPTKPKTTRKTTADKLIEAELNIHKNINIGDEVYVLQEKNIIKGKVQVIALAIRPTNVLLGTMANVPELIHISPSKVFTTKAKFMVYFKQLITKW